MFLDLQPLELNKTGDGVPLPLNGKGGRIYIKIPAFAASDSGSYEVGIYDSNEADPGYIASQQFALAPFARFPFFEVPDSLASPHLGFRLLSHENFETATFNLTPQFQVQRQSSNLMVSLGISVEALSDAVAAALGATTPTYEQLTELVNGLEIARNSLIQSLRDDIAIQGTLLGTVDNRSSQNAQDIAAQGTLLGTVDNRSQQNQSAIQNQPDLAAPPVIGSSTPNKGIFLDVESGPSGLVLQNSFASPHGKTSGISGGIIDRLAFIDRRAVSFQSSNINNPHLAFDKNGGVFSAVLPNTTGTYTIKLKAPYHVYAASRVVLVTQSIESVSVEILAGSITEPTWQSVSIPEFTTNGNQQSLDFEIPGIVYQHELKINFTPPDGLVGRIYLAAIFPKRPDSDEKQIFLPLGDAVEIEAFSPKFKISNDGIHGCISPNSIELTAPDNSRWRYSPGIDGNLTVEQVG